VLHRLYYLEKENVSESESETHSFPSRWDSLLRDTEVMMREVLEVCRTYFSWQAGAKQTWVVVPSLLPKYSDLLKTPNIIYCTHANYQQQSCVSWAPVRGM
jgi:hypothetical protein